ncbi:chaperone protein dnaJ A6, chloroplastic-like [Selaginella moellendorffii]|uniref:chaperone protein dnaJ A6, chloroplastic-like n=1 Tax=Selaginella moellendorffii TaxID=88036 RepID=UPI000D1C5656|nr:chaperone protein dnaJ A6, chloroplastic-like [Selaginella moellendorffii]|eukprot:XP_024516689.1 chaperone protein dnaJ A6, chloroplastic-like [Selaginella moellendorffii]
MGGDRPSGDLYAVLGLYRGASPREIRSAYRRLARIWHPDKYLGRDPEAAKLKFQEIHNAYVVLSDWKKRLLYDQQSQFQGFHQNPTYGMKDFLGELRTMMQQQVHEEENASFEDLRATFFSMFSPEHSFHSNRSLFNKLENAHLQRFHTRHR